MLGFHTPKATEPPETVEAARVRLRDELVRELHEIDHQLDHIGQAARQFRKEHFAVIDGRVLMVAAGHQEHCLLEQKWRAFAAQTFKLEQRRHRILESWANLKGAANAN